MDAGCSRSLDPFGTEIFNRQDNNQIDWIGRVRSDRSRLTLFLVSICLLSSLATSQANTAETITAPPTVSVAELRGCGRAGAQLKDAHKEFSRGNLVKAQRDLDLVSEIDPLCGAALSMRSLIDLAAKKTQAAIEDALRATAIDANDAQSFVALAMAYNSSKNFPKAADASRRALELYPVSWQGRLELAKSSYGQGQYALALHELDEIGRDFPDVHLVRGNVLLYLGRRREAFEEFQCFLREDPQDPRNQQIRAVLGK
jgi:tetratricopeptide (TPR) repeat protein